MKFLYSNKIRENIFYLLIAQNTFLIAKAPKVIKNMYIWLICTEDDTMIVGRKEEFPDELTPLDFINKNLPSYKRNRLILDVLFRSKDVEKAGTGFQRVNELCNSQNVSWTFRKEAYGFFF